MLLGNKSIVPSIVQNPPTITAAMNSESRAVQIPAYYFEKLKKLTFRIVVHFFIDDVRMLIIVFNFLSITVFTFIFVR